ncbi:hypothetical protein [Thalassiella azotivora]
MPVDDPSEPAAAAADAAAAPDPVAALPLKDQLWHAIGRTAQANAVLESHLRDLHRRLVGIGPAHALTPLVRGVGALVDQSRAMMAALQWPDDWHAVAASALQAAKAADEQRHRAVHDVWQLLATQPDGDVRLYRGQLVRSTPWYIEFREAELDYVRRAAVANERAGIRIFALMWWVMDADPISPSLLPPERRAETVANWRRTVSDDFIMIETGSWRFDDD